MISSSQSTYCTSSERGGHPQSCGDGDVTKIHKKTYAKTKTKTGTVGEKIQSGSLRSDF